MRNAGGQHANGLHLHAVDTIRFLKSLLGEITKNQYRTGNFIILVTCRAHNEIRQKA